MSERIASAMVNKQGIIGHRQVVYYKGMPFLFSFSGLALSSLNSYIFPLQLLSLPPLFSMFSSAKSNPDTEIPDLSGKVVFIAGGEVKFEWSLPLQTNAHSLGKSALGKETATQLAKHNPSAIYITALEIQKGHLAVVDIKKAVPGGKIHLLQMDLASLKSVQRCCQAIS
jgi:hypothetical protein